MLNENTFSKYPEFQINFTPSNIHSLKEGINVSFLVNINELQYPIKYKLTY